MGDRAPFVLDNTDPIDAVLIEMVTLYRRKRADYGLDGDPLSNFYRTAEISDWALAGAQATEALNRPRVPDDIDALRARLAAPGKTTRIGPRPTP